MEQFEAAAEQARAMRQAGADIKEILCFLASAADRLVGNNTVASILILDERGLLRNGASPQLPADYLKAIDAIKPHPDLGTCASAAATGQIVITPDFHADSKWAELRHLPLALGFHAAWSAPIIDSEGRVRGTFGTYFRETRAPKMEEIMGVTILAAAAAEALSLPELSN